MNPPPIHAHPGSGSGGQESGQGAGVGMSMCLMGARVVNPAAGVEWTFTAEQVGEMIFGRQWLAARMFGRINPHWYMEDCE